MIAAHHQAVRTETAVSVLINALAPAAIIWLLGAPAPAALPGVSGLLKGLVLGSALATFLMTLVVTLLVRGRVRAGKLPPLARASLAAGIRWLPAPLALRALAMAAVAAVVLVPLWSLLVVTLHLLPMSRNQFVVFNLEHFPS